MAAAATIGLQWRSKNVFGQYGIAIVGPVVENAAGVGARYEEGSRLRAGLGISSTSWLPSIGVDLGEFEGFSGEDAGWVGVTMSKGVGRLRITGAIRPDVRTVGATLNLRGLELSYSIFRLSDGTALTTTDRSYHGLGFTMAPDLAAEDRISTAVVSDARPICSMLIESGYVDRITMSSGVE